MFSNSYNQKKKKSIVTVLLFLNETIISMKYEEIKKRIV